MKKIIPKCLFIAAFALVMACTSANKKANHENDLDVKVEEQTVNKFESVFSAPSPEEMLMLFEGSDLVFNSAVLHDAEKVTEYISSKDLTVNLGVYVTDVAYLNMFKQYSGMTNYLESVFKVIDKLDMGGVYREFDFKKVFREMDKPDSLIVLSEGVYHAVINYLTENNKEHQLCLISYGSIIELLYLTLESIPEFKADDPILQSIFDQHMQLANLTEFASQYSGLAEIDEMIKRLSNIERILAEVAHADSETVVKETEDGVLHIGGGKKHGFSKEQYEKFKLEVTETRHYIIK